MNDFVIKNGVLEKYTGKESKVVIPDSVTKIGVSAFYECKSLKEITIPYGITEIKGVKCVGAFSGCTSLKKVVIPDSVKKIGDCAFDGCKSLTEITIPDSVTKISEYAFRGCENLADENGFVIVKNVLYDYFGNAEKVIIPDSVTEIGGCAFWGCKSLKEVTIPDSVKKIGGYAFFCCVSLENITIPDSVTEIGGGAFKGCESLTSVRTPDSVTVIGDSAFLGCKSLKEITIPDSVTKIGGSAFYECKSLEKIRIPDSVKAIGKFAFYNCESLTSVRIPDSVTEIGDWAFWGCNNLIKINVNSSDIFKMFWKSLNGKYYNDDTPIKLLKNAVKKKITDKNIISKIKLKKKDLISDTIKNDDAESLSFIFSLYKKILLDELNTYIDSAKDSINVKAFLLDYKNKTYSVEKQDEHEKIKVEKELGLRERTITEWKKIFNFKKENDSIIITGYKGEDVIVEIPDKIGKNPVIAIGEHAFSPNANRIDFDTKEKRRKMTSVIIPDSVKEIGGSAFDGCTSLKEITIPDSVTKIGEYAFWGCEKIVIKAPKNPYAHK